MRINETDNKKSTDKISIPNDDKYIYFSKDSKKWSVILTYKKSNV